MGKKAPQQPAEQKVVNQSIPAEFMPYMSRVLDKGEQITSRPYEAYQGPRLAAMSDASKQGLALAQSSAGNWQGELANADKSANWADQSLGRAQGYVGSANFDPTKITPQNINDYTMGDFNTQAVGQYMNPFIDLVLNNQVSRLNDQFMQDQIGRDDAAIRNKAFGVGSGQIIADRLAQDSNRKDMRDAIASGLASAFDSARNTWTDVGKTNIDSLLKSQDLRANLDYNAQRDNNDFALKDAQLELSKADAMRGIGSAFTTNAGQWANNGSTRSNLTTADFNRLMQAGQMEQDYNQRSLDLAYNDFVNQRDYDRNNLAFMSGLVNGQQIPVNSDVRVYEAPQNPYSQALGAGIGAAGLYQSLRG